MEQLGFLEGLKNVQVNLEKWNKISEFKDCPPLDKKVLAAHDNTIYIGVLEIGGQEEYLWRLENERVIEWVDVFEVDFWLEIS